MSTSESSLVIERAWNGDQLRVAEPGGELYHPPLRMGLVIGTYAAVPYVHLQLESRRRNFPHVPTLVHDDGSHRRDDLARLCEQYGCDFECNRPRQPRCLGDLSCFLGGLHWARTLRRDVLVKVSRRWVFLVDWTESLSRLALESQYATFCSYTTTFNFGFRSECMGMAVSLWGADGFLDEATGRIRRADSVFVEGYLHQFARGFERLNGPTAERWRERNPQPQDRNGYAVWELMGTDRCAPRPEFLWHDSAGPDGYFALAEQWGLPYVREDFRDPNQGGGTGA